MKVIRPELAAEEAFREQFQKEARLAASIDHPAVVPIYEAGEADGTLFVAMRLVDGLDLRQILKQGGGLELDRAVEIASRVAEALQATHEVGLVTAMSSRRTSSSKASGSTSRTSGSPARPRVAKR